MKYVVHVCFLQGKNTEIINGGRSDLDPIYTIMSGLQNLRYRCTRKEIKPQKTKKWGGKIVFCLVFTFFKHFLKLCSESLNNARTIHESFKQIVNKCANKSQFCIHEVKIIICVHKIIFEGCKYALKQTLYPSKIIV